jgi:hypothetical protein
MFTRLLTLLPLLLCPLLMLACMWAVRNRETPERQARAGQEELPTAARVAQLEHELAELRSRLPQAVAAGEPASTPRPDPCELHATARRCSGVDRPVMIPMPPGPGGRHTGRASVR